MAAELAVRGVLVLAERYGQGPVRLEEICSARKLPKQYLAKILGALARAELVSPTRGKRGGYELARDPRRITLLEVVEAVEGPVALNLCQHTPPRCDAKNCQVRPVWTELQALVRGKLSSVALHDCLGQDGPAA